MSTPVGFERWEPGHPWGDVLYADGSRTPVPDPDGSIEAETKKYGAQQNAMPKVAPPPTSTPSLTGGADALSVAPPPPPPAAPGIQDIPPPPPPPPRPGTLAMPATAPLSATERASVTAATTPSPQDLAALGGPPVAAPGATAAAPPGAAPGAPATPAAQALSAAGVAIPAAPAPPAGGAARNPAEESIRALAPGLIASTASVQAQGPDAQSSQNILDTAGESLLLRGKGISEQVAAGAATNQDEAAQANQAYFDAWRARNQALGDEAAATRARDEASSRLTQAQQRPIQPHADFSDFGVAISLLGAAAGGLAEGLSGGRLKNTTLDMLQELTRNWIETQKVNKGALVTDLERVLGDKNAALSLAQSKIKTSLADEADSRKRFARSAAAMRELGATASTLRAQALDDYNKSQALVMGHVATNVGFAAPKPVGPGVVKLDNPTTRELASLGITPDAWDKGLEQAVSAGREAPTIAQTAITTKQIDADVALLDSIRKANGGTLPTKGVVNIPQALVPTLSRVGYQPGMAAEQVTGLLNTYLTQKAKSYGGVITESDRESAGLEFGTSGEGFLRGMQRLRDANNKGITTALEKKFPGVGQQALEILLRRTSASVTPGIAQPAVDPLEVQNVTETGPATPTFAETPDEQQMRQEQQQRQADRKELLAQPDVAKQQQERERLPAAVRYAPF